jgi:hypothetical protein
MKPFLPKNLKTNVEVAFDRVFINILVPNQWSAVTVNFDVVCNPLEFAETIDKLISIRNEIDTYWNNTELYLEEHSIDKKVYFVQNACILTIFTRYRHSFTGDPNLLAKVPELVRKKYRKLEIQLEKEMLQ